MIPISESNTAFAASTAAEAEPAVGLFVVQGHMDVTYSDVLAVIHASNVVWLGVF